MQKHCFANPNNGKICCILSLAIMIVCRHGVMLKDGERSQRLFCDDSLACFGNILIFNSTVHMTRSYFHLISTLECAVPRDDIAEALVSVGPIENCVCRTAQPVV